MAAADGGILTKEKSDNRNDVQSVVDSAVPLASSFVPAAPDYTFAFNVSTFSDRVLRIEIVEDDVEQTQIGGGRGGEYDEKKKKRLREDDKVEDDDGECEYALVTLHTDYQYPSHVDGKEEEEAHNYHGKRSESNEMVEDLFSDERVVSVSNGIPSSTVCDSYMTWNTKRPVRRINDIHINSVILAAKSAFFLKLFSNGMKESSQTHVTLTIKASEEGPFMDLLQFMYSNTLSSSTVHELMDVLMMADKFEVASCMIYCSQVLGNFEMSLDYALLCLDLPSSVQMTDFVQPFAKAAKQFLTSRYNDITKCSEEVLRLPLTGFEVVLANDDLRAPSEDDVLDLVLKYIRTHYTSTEERQSVLMTRLCHLIRFSHCSARKLKGVVSWRDFNPESMYKVVLDSVLTGDRKQKPRAYTIIPVQVMEFRSSQPRCVVYMSLKHDECANLFPSGKLNSRSFLLNGHTFSLSAQRVQQNESHCFGLYLKMHQKGSEICQIDFKFSVMTKLREDFEDKFRTTYSFTRGETVGVHNLVNKPWTEFIAVDSDYFINDILYLKAELIVKQPKS
ncbi:hypothetical protein QQ045_012119 [Rhodiola kirilowii]